MVQAGAVSQMRYRPCCIPMKTTIEHFMECEECDAIWLDSDDKAKCAACDKQAKSCGWMETRHNE